ncbi:MAG: hypothetical protein R2708_26025 [Vicinamibacterales bacterium]
MSLRIPRALAVLLMTAGLSAAIPACHDSRTPTSATPVSVDPTLTAALARAIDDEYQAETIYQGVLDDFGAVLPFINVLTAEERHSASIARLYTARGLAAPANTWAVGAVPHFATVPAACAAGVSAEQANIAMYDALLAAALPADVRQVFTNNRQASLVNHLPAFERCR